MANARVVKPHNPVERVRRAIQNSFDASVVGHDMDHIERVENNALYIARAEEASKDIVQIAALLHDFHRILERDYGRHVSPEEAEPMTIEIMRNNGVAPDQVPHINRCIRATEKFRCAGDVISEELTNEEKVVRDADMLDALGAVGIARAFMFGGKLNEPIWSSKNISLKFAPGETHSIVHHFHEKLLCLESEMLTQEGARLAAERTAYMKIFLGKLSTELNDPGVAARCR